jgi:hypothetical protein
LQKRSCRIQQDTAIMLLSRFTTFFFKLRHKTRVKSQQRGYFDCQKAAVVKWTPQDSQSPSAHILHRVLLLAFVSVAHFGHFAKNWVI